MTTGNEISCPITVVARSRFADAPTTWGANPSSLKDSTLSEIVIPFSLAEISDEYADLGSRFFARCCAIATVSNHWSRAITTPGFHHRVVWAARRGSAAPGRAVHGASDHRWAGACADRRPTRIRRSPECIPGPARPRAAR